MMLINFFENIIDSFFLCIETKFRHFKQSITARNEQQQLEYIYELNFHDKEANREEINNTFQWLDIDDKDEFILLSIKNTKKEDLELFYLEMATILQTTDITKDLQSGIFMCIGDYMDLVYQDINPQIDYQMDPQMNQQNKKIFIFEKILRYAKMRFDFADAEHFQKSHLNKIFQKQIFSIDLDQTVTFEQFYQKQYDLRNVQNLILSNKIEPKDISQMEDGESIVGEILQNFIIFHRRVERLLQQQFILNPRHINLTAKSMFNKQPQIYQLSNDFLLTNNIKRNIQYLQLEQPPNWQGKIKDQLKQIKEIALKQNWQADFAIFQNLLHQQINQDSLNLINQAIQSFYDKIKQNLVMYQNFPYLKSDLNSWDQLFKDLKTRWKFQQLFQSNKQLIFEKQEFVDTLEQIL